MLNYTKPESHFSCFLCGIQSKEVNFATLPINPPPLTTTLSHICKKWNCRFLHIPNSTPMHTHTYTRKNSGKYHIAMLVPAAVKQNMYPQVEPSWRVAFSLQ
ncbi:hypothetical protein ATANTOWER_024750 [Ataeniobius toweri]|uniref:Uncharacterized protein n=1 Tax=Ataeniobius toweri TaxID=208326 RepID=A0ABU7A7Z5_9TELE|nr:hypothetical protein [Ataeniobius toweri]